MRMAIDSSEGANTIAAVFTACAVADCERPSCLFGARFPLACTADIIEVEAALVSAFFAAVETATGRDLSLLESKV